MPDFEVVIKGDVQDVEKGLDNVQKKLAETAISATKLDSALQKGVSGTNQATQALTNLGRVVQDAPYGFIGIANNINPLLESFQRLKKETGSVGGSLKALASSFVGGGGIGLAVSVATSLLVTFGSKLFGATKQTQLARIAADEYAVSMKKAFEQAGQEFGKVSLIVAALQAQNTTLEQRKKLLDQLNGINSTYFTGLKLERGEVEGLSAAYQAFADNIFKVAKAKAAEEQIGKLSTKLVGVTDQINNLTNSLEGNNRALTFADVSKLGGLDGVKKAYEDIGKIINKDVITLQDSKLLSGVTGISENKINDILQERQILRRKEAQLLGNISELSKQVAKNDLSSIIGFEKPDTKKLKESIERLVKDSGQIVVFPVEVTPTVNFDKLKTSGSLSPIQSEFDKLSALLPSVEISIPKLSFDNIDSGVESLKKLLSGGEQLATQFHTKLPEGLIKTSASLEDAARSAQAFLDLQNELAAVLQDTVINAINTFSEAVGNALATGDIRSIFSGLFGVLADGMKAFGQALVKYGVYLALAKTALRISSPALAIAAGVALQILGAYVEAKTAKLASGGIIPQGYPNDSFPALLSSNEAVIPLDKLPGMLQQNATTPTLEVSHKILGQDLYLLVKRVERSNTTNG